MSSESMQTLADPVFRSKMPLFDGAMAPAGLSKPQNASGFLGKQTLQYNGACFAYDPRGRDGAVFTPPWSNSETSLLDSMSPVNHLSAMEGQKRTIHRQDSSSSEEGHSRPSSKRHTPLKQGFVLYTKSPEISSPSAAASVAVKRTGGQNSSSHSENSVYLAIPKPVYGRNPCCTELGCLMGHRYSLEHGSPRIPNTVYEHDWMQTRDAHYTERLPIQRKAQDALRQQRGLQFEPGADPLKRVAFSPGRARTLPGMLEPNYPSYPCTPTRSLFGSLSEHSQPLQTSPRGYPSLYPSHPTYEHMTSEVYQEHSPMSKYGQLAQHPVFYYPQANVEVENRTRCKDSGCKQREDVPVIHKHAISNPREHYIVPHSLLAEIPLPSGDMLPNHSFMQGFDYPYYAVPRFHLNASQIRAPLKRQHSLPSYHSSRLNVSPSRQHMSHPMTPAASQHKDKPNSSLRADQPHSSSPYLRVDHGSPSRRLSRPGVSPSGIQFSRFFSPPLTNLHTDPPVVPPAGLSMDRILDYSSREAQVTCPKQPKSIPVSPAAWPPQSPNRISDRIHAAAPNLRKILYSPAVATESKHGDSVSSFGSAVQKGSLKRTISHSSPPIKIKKEDMDLYEVEPTKKQQKLDTENAQVGIKNYSPPMPVIDNVFSLAPYQAYLQASGVLFPGRIPHRAIQSSEQHEVKRKTDAKEKRSDRGDQQPVVSLVSKEIAPPDKQTDETVVDVTERRNIKVEKVDPSDIDNSVETGVSQNDCIKVTLKKEIEEMVISDSEPTSLTKKCETDELESKPSVTDETETSEQTDRSISPSHLQTESKHSFRNIPAQSLKLSTYNIIIPVIRRCSSAAPPEEPPAQPMAELLPKQENQLPVRKHFIELHQSFCKLISKSVSASSEQELKKWLSQVKTTEPASSSAKVQKVSCLLGVKARETWLSEEIKSALHKVLERLREYTAQERCPFPHVMRAGAVFLPMLVVKELLFPMVQGSFIDQVLQEHKVELRPTTLSEEKILVQLHKRAFSSRLRRLMSLKHLPDIYVDVVNLLYYTCVCQHLESTSPDVQKRVQQKNLSAKLKQGTHDKLHDYLSLVGGWERTEPGCWWKNETLPREFVICDLLGLDMAPECKDGGHEASDSRDIAASAVSCSESHPQGLPKDQEAQLHFNANRTKSRVKSSSRRTFLDGSLSDEKEEEAGGVENTVVEGVLSTFIEKSRGSQEPQGAENGGADHLADCSLSPQSKISENSWTCPLMSDELSPSASDAEPEQPCGLQPDSQSPGPAKPQVRAKSCSGMILKLRRMFSEGLNRKKSRYQAVSESGTFADPSFSQADGSEGGNTEKDLHRRTPKVTHRWQRTGSFCHALRPLSSSSKRKSLLKIKYCPYLSACHSAEHRRRWVLRSAVQRARRAMRFYYPDLVGKTIHHLYEEDDKSEVWYRGEVLRIHEAHTNPLKTIFEVRYDSEPEWKYYLELLIDYKKGWLKIED